MRKVLLFLAVPVLFALSCAKERSFEEGIDGNPSYETSWQFKDTSVMYGGNATTYELSATGSEMNYEGASTDGLGVISIQVQSLSGAIKQGNYTSAKGEVVFSYESGGAPRFDADNVDSIGEKLTVTILSIDSVSVIGFFSGTMRTATGVVIPVTEGKFNYRKAVDPAADSSIGTLGSSADTCTGASLAGTYYKAVPLASSNTVSVNVNITKIGAYTIATDTVSGFYFTKTGSFTTLGTQTVILNGAGTPADSGTAKFTVQYGASKCSFDVSVDTIATSEGTLGTAANNCTGVVLAGTYEQVKSLNFGNTVTLEVNITKAGFYSISTDTVNGFYFSKAGTFSATGPQIVVLTGTGTPTTAGDFNFAVKYNVSSCGFSVTVADAPVVTDAYFQFNDGATVVTAVPDNASIDELGGFTTFTLNATSAGDSSFSIVIASPNALQTGVSYTTSSLTLPAAFNGTDANTASIYSADASTAGVVMTIKFDLIDLTGKMVSGTFSGTAKGAAGANKTITSGKFKSPLP